VCHYSIHRVVGNQGGVRGWSYSARGEGSRTADLWGGWPDPPWRQLGDSMLACHLPLFAEDPWVRERGSQTNALY
jgi:hypothetical protein